MLAPNGLGICAKMWHSKEPLLGPADASVHIEEKTMFGSAARPERFEAAIHVVRTLQPKCSDIEQSYGAAIPH